jgi:hypothetical protein
MDAGHKNASMTGTHAMPIPSSPALVLFVLAPVLGELVSAFLSPLEFLHPLRLAITLVPYGCGAIVAREITVRQRKGFVSLVLLGLAFGLLFEGIVTRVLFNPNWGGLGPLAGYGRAHGFSWVLAVGIVHFQAMISIVCPILIAEAQFPTRRHDSWVRTPTLVLCCCALPAWTFVMGLFVPFLPKLPHALALIGVVIGLLAIAQCIPAEPLAVGAGRVPPPRVFGIIGGTGMTMIMLGTFVAPGWDSRPSAAIMFSSLLTILIVELGALLWFSSAGTWDDRHRLALVIGLLTFFLAFGILKDCESFTGRSLASGAALWLLLRLQRQARKTVPPPSSPPCHVTGSSSSPEH